MVEVTKYQFAAFVAQVHTATLYRGIIYLGNDSAGYLRTKFRTWSAIFGAGRNDSRKSQQ